MTNPESAVQLNFSQVVEERLRFPDLSRLKETIANHSPYTVVYFHGVKGIDLCAQELKRFLEEKESEVRIVHYQQLLFEHGQPFGEYSESPLIVKPSKPCFTIVSYFEDSDEERITKVLGRINQAQDLISWILLVPRWRSMKPNLRLEDWLHRQRAKQFYLQP